MKALEVFIKGHHARLAGIGDDGGLYATVKWDGGPDRVDSFSVSIGRFYKPADENLRCEVPSIRVGTEVLVRSSRLRS